MPNKANRSRNNNNAGKGITRDAGTQRSEPKQNPERSDIKHNTNQNDGNTSRTSNGGRKLASGGS